MRARAIAPLLLGVAIVALWEAWVRLSAVDRAVFAAPSSVLKGIRDSFSPLIDHSATTLAETAIGLLLGITAGIALACVMSFSALARQAVEPFVVALQTIPALVLAPLLVLLLGFGWGPRIAVVVLVVFFPVSIAATGAFLHTDSARLDLARAFGTSQRQIFRVIVFPGALPAIFDGIRISAAYALGSAAVAEQIGGARSGLGLFISRAQRNGRADLVLAGVAVIAALSLAIYWAVGVLARRLTPWARPAILEDSR